MNRTKVQRGNNWTVLDVEDWMSSELEPWQFVPNAVETGDGSTYPRNAIVVNDPELLDPLKWVNLDVGCKGTSDSENDAEVEPKPFSK
jgi:hypothetical protein